MIRFVLAIALSPILAAPVSAQDADLLAGKRVAFLGDSNTQAGGYVSFATYYLERLHPKKDFDILSLGLASETLSGLTEENHAGGKFPRPCLFERLGRVLEKTKPDIVFACYGMNDGIYLPLDRDRFAAFQKGVTKLMEQCKDAGVKQIFLIAPPIYDLTPKAGEFNYDAVLAEYAKWEAALKVPGVRIIDLHTAMRKARNDRTEPFSKDWVHPGDDGHSPKGENDPFGIRSQDSRRICVGDHGRPTLQVGGRAPGDAGVRMDEAHRIYPREDRPTGTARDGRNGRGETPGKDRRSQARKVIPRHSRFAFHLP